MLLDSINNQKNQSKSELFAFVDEPLELELEDVQEDVREKPYREPTFNQTANVQIANNPRQTYYPSESEATKWLSHCLFFVGYGKQYLGYQMPHPLKDLDPERKAKNGPQRWHTPTIKAWQDYYKFDPLWDHLKGLPRGLCRDVEETHVPCLVVDGDRHSANIKPADHINMCHVIALHLIRNHNNYRWMAEVNPRNGSVKFFGFTLDGQPIPIEIAKQHGEQILIELTNMVGRIEVFPAKSMSQFFLPFRPDKITICGKNVLHKVTRRIKVDGKYQPIECYSMLKYNDWLNDGEQLNWETLKVELEKACANLPYVAPLSDDGLKPKLPYVAPLPDDGPKPIKTSSAKRADDVAYPKAPTGAKGINTSDLHQEPDSFKRLCEFGRRLCRQRKRVVSTGELLASYKEHDLFTGEWSDNLARRTFNAGYILDYIENTFDAHKCGSEQKHIIAQRYDALAKKYFPKGAKDLGRFSIDEYGNKISMRNKYYAEATTKTMAFAMDALHYCCNTYTNPDGTTSRDTIRQLFEQAKAEGRIDQEWSDELWVVIWENLVHIGFCKCSGWIAKVKAKVWVITYTPPVYEKAQRLGLGDSYDVFIDNKNNKKNNTQQQLNYYIGNDIKNHVLCLLDWQDKPPP